MATLAPPRDPNQPADTKKKDAPTYAQPCGYKHFWLRRLHSLLGLAFGGYVTVHLIVNASGWSPKAYQQNVDKIHSLEPMLPAIEIAAIFLPLLVHMIYGAYIATTGVKFNTTKYNYGGNVRYLLQRVTAVILVAFLVYHVGTLHKWGFAALGWNGGHPMFVAEGQAYQSTVTAIQAPYGSSSGLNTAASVFYLLGVWSAVFHWANGLWSSAIAWGATVTEKAQRRWGHVCLGFGITMMIVGTLAWAAFAFGDPNYNTNGPTEVVTQVHHDTKGAPIVTPAGGMTPADAK